MSWGVLAYIVADERVNLGDTLDKAAEADLRKLLKAAKMANIPIAAQIDYEEQRASWRQVRAAGANSQQIELREANANNPNVLKDFLDWGRKELAKLGTTNHLVMLWGHGTGPTGFFSDASPNSPARDSGHPLSPRQLASALKQAGKNAPFDILLVKACFAATLEVAYELEGATKFIIASQNLIPSQTFWPYERLFKHLQPPAPAIDPVRATAEQLLEEVGNFYTVTKNRPEKVEVPYALLDLTEVDGDSAVRRVVKAVRALSTELHEQHVDVATVAKRSLPGERSVCPGDPALLDIEHFCDELLSHKNQKLALLAGDLKKSLPALVRKRRPDASDFRGISLFYHPGYSIESPVRDSALFGLYKRTRLNDNREPIRWIDIAYQNTVISKFAN